MCRAYRLLTYWTLLGNLSLGCQLNAQTDEISVSTIFKGFLEIHILSGTNQRFEINTIQSYKYGVLHPVPGTERQVSFEVHSSVDYLVHLEAPWVMSSPSGHLIDIQNVGYKISSIGSHQVGVHLCLVNADMKPSSAQVLGGEYLLVSPGKRGNAGRTSDNRFILDFDIGTPEVRLLSGLPPLIDQYIMPDTYSATLLLLASSVPLES